MVEVDGPIHEYTPEEDAIRYEFLESQGLRGIRVANDAVFDALDDVIAAIRAAIQRSPGESSPDHPITARD